MKTAYGPKRTKGLRNKYLPPFLIAAALLFNSCASTAQVDTTKLPQVNNSSGYDFVTGIIARGFLRPPTDTFHLAQAHIGSIAVVNGVLYTWTGTYWNGIQGTGSGADASLVRSIIADSNIIIRGEILAAGHDNWGSDYVHTGVGFLGDGTNLNNLNFDPVYITPTTRHDSLVAAVAAITGGISPVTVRSTFSGDTLVKYMGGGIYRIKSLIAGDNVAFQKTDSTIRIDVTIPVGGIEINADTFSLSTTGNRTVGTDKLVTHILIKPATPLTALKIGTSIDAVAYLTDTPISSGGWTDISLDAYIETSSDIYFSGITSATQIKIITTPFHE
jgi:hypothetical protein